MYRLDMSVAGRRYAHTGWFCVECRGFEVIGVAGIVTLLIGATT